MQSSLCWLFLLTWSSTAQATTQYYSNATQAQNVTYGNNTYAPTALQPTAYATNYYWSQYLTPPILGTVYVIVNNHNQTVLSTSTDSAVLAQSWNSLYVQNGTISVLTRSDVNEAGTVTATLSIGINSSTVLTYPTPYLTQSGPIFWGGLFPYPEYGTTCCGYGVTTSATPSHYPFPSETGSTNPHDVRGWLYTTDYYVRDYVGSTNVSSFFAPATLNSFTESCPHPLCPIGNSAAAASSVLAVGALLDTTTVHVTNSPSSSATDAASAQALSAGAATQASPASTPDPFASSTTLGGATADAVSAGGSSSGVSTPAQTSTTQATPTQTSIAQSVPPTVESQVAGSTQQSSPAQEPSEAQTSQTAAVPQDSSPASGAPATTQVTESISDAASSSPANAVSVLKSAQDSQATTAGSQPPVTAATAPLDSATVLSTTARVINGPSSEQALSSAGTESHPLATNQVAQSSSEAASPNSAGVSNTVSSAQGLDSTTLDSSLPVSTQVVQPSSDISSSSAANAVSVLSSAVGLHSTITSFTSQESPNSAGTSISGASTQLPLSVTGSGGNPSISTAEAVSNQETSFPDIGTEPATLSVGTTTISILPAGLSRTVSDSTTVITGFEIGDTTVPVGSTVIVDSTPVVILTSGSQTYTVVAGTTLGTSQQVAAGSTSPYDTPFIVVGSSTVTANSDSAYVISGQTLALDSSITLGSGSSTTVIALQTGSSQTELIIGSSTSTISPQPQSVLTTAIPAPIVIGSSQVTLNSNSQYVIGSQTLAPGSAITVSGTPYSLAPGGSELLVGTSTEILTTHSGLASYILSALGGSAASDGDNTSQTSTSTSDALLSTPFTSSNPSAASGPASAQTTTSSEATAVRVSSLALLGLTALLIAIM